MEWEPSRTVSETVLRLFRKGPFFVQILVEYVAWWPRPFPRVRRTVFSVHILFFQNIEESNVA